MKKLFLCSYFAGVKDTFKDFMNNDTKGKKVLFIPTANIDEETKFLVDEAKEVFESLGMEVEDLEISKLNEKTIKNFIDSCENKFGKLDSITLSSTHLPWLSSYFEKIIPQTKLYDPADSLVKAIKPYITTGEGKIHSIISESEKYPAKEFLKILDILNIKLDYAFAPFVKNLGTSYANIFPE